MSGDLRMTVPISTHPHQVRTNLHQIGKGWGRIEAPMLAFHLLAIARYSWEVKKLRNRERLGDDGW